MLNFFPRERRSGSIFGMKKFIIKVLDIKVREESIFPRFFFLKKKKTKKKIIPPQ